MAVSSPGIAKGGSFRWDFELDGLNSSLSSHLTVCLQPPPPTTTFYFRPLCHKLVCMQLASNIGRRPGACARSLQDACCNFLFLPILLIWLQGPSMNTHLSFLYHPPSFLFYSTPLLFFIRLLLPFFFFFFFDLLLESSVVCACFSIFQTHTRGQLGEGRTPQWLR